MIDATLVSARWQMTRVKVWSLILLLCAGCSGDAARGSTDGATVFAAWCAACHGPQGRPPEAMALRLGVRDLTAPELRSRVSTTLVEAQVRLGSNNKLMPSFQGALTDAQIAAVAAYVAGPSFVHHAR